MEQETRLDFEAVPVFLVCVDGLKSPAFISENMKGITHDTNEAHYFLFENAAKRFCDLFNKETTVTRAFSIKCFVAIEEVTEQHKRRGEQIDLALIRIWEKIKTRVWK